MVPIKYGSLTELLMMPEELAGMVEAIQSMPDDGLMVEWGCGGSTCKWLDTLKPNQKLITIEHNQEWFNTVGDSIRSHFGDTSSQFQFLFAPEYPGYVHGYGVVEEENPYGMASYVAPSDDIFDGDVFLVDGIARGICTAVVLLKRRKKNSRVFIHDYSLRVPAYNWISQFCDVKHIGPTLVELTLL